MKMPDNLVEAEKNISLFQWDNILMSQISGVDFPVSNLNKVSPASINIEEVIPQKFYACHYKNDWYFGITDTF